MTWKKHTVWIEFNDSKDPVTLTNVENVVVMNDVVSISWMEDKKKVMHTYHYPFSRVRQIRESNTYEGEYDVENDR